MEITKKNVIKRSTNFDVAEAFGLGRESLRQEKLEDPFGPVVITVFGAMCGFLTAVTSDDNLRQCGSVIADTDGYDTHLPFEWRKRTLRHNRAKTLGYVKGFQLYHATFAATGVPTKCGMIPERVFLFPKTKGFNLTKIIDRLRLYRAETHVPLFCDLLQHVDLSPLV